MTQFTYFQQCGGIDCKPVSIEITYGLERLAMYLQDVESIWDLSWNSERSYGEIWLPFEKGQCHFNFEASNPERLKQLFAIYEAEAADLIEKQLPAPALDFVLKCSHTFNLLEARGVISVTERTATIGRIRNLARKVAEAWLAEREALGFPLLKGELSRQRPDGFCVDVVLLMPLPSVSWRSLCFEGCCGGRRRRAEPIHLA